MAVRAEAENREVETARIRLGGFIVGAFAIQIDRVATQQPDVGPRDPEWAEELAIQKVSETQRILSAQTHVLVEIEEPHLVEPVEAGSGTRTQLGIQPLWS